MYYLYNAFRAMAAAIASDHSDSTSATPINWADPYNAHEVERARSIASYALAIEAGIENRSYPTVRHGWVPSYAGTAWFKDHLGNPWMAQGFCPDGNAHHIGCDGYIKFSRIADVEVTLVKRRPVRDSA